MGRFITSFAGAEAGVHLVTRRLSRLDDEIARALFKGMRLSDITERTRALLTIKPEDGTKPVLPDAGAAIVKACLDQIGLISSRRHNLVHRVSGYGATGIFVTNILGSKSSENAEWETFTLPELTAMTGDCDDIFNQLDRLSSDNRVSEAVRIGAPAWRYRPAQPSPKRPNTRGSAE